MEGSVSDVPGEAFAGKRFILTGKLENLTRGEAVALLEARALEINREHEDTLRHRR